MRPVIALTRQQVKYGVAVFVLGCLLAVGINSCNGDCKAAVEKDKLSALIGQLQGNCCVYEADPYGSCWQRAKPFFPGLKYRCVGDAAVCLGEMRSQAKVAVPALIGALETGSNNYDTGDGPIPTRNQIMYALGKIGDPRAVKPLIAALNSPRPVDAGLNARPSLKPVGQTTAIAALGLLGPTAKEAVSHIIPFLKSSNQNHFEAATKALVQIKDTRAIPALIEALKHPNYARQAVLALGEFGSLADDAVPTLIKMLETSTNYSDSRKVASTIGKIRGEAAIPKIAIIYRQKILEFYKDLEAIVKNYGDNSGELVSDSTDKERGYIQLSTGEKLYVQLDRSVSNSSLTSGQVWIEKEDKKAYMQRFYTFEGMRVMIRKILNNRLQATER